MKKMYDKIFFFNMQKNTRRLVVLTFPITSPVVSFIKACRSNVREKVAWNIIKILSM